MAITKDLEKYDSQRSGITQTKGIGNMKRKTTLSPGIKQGMFMQSKNIGMQLATNSFKRARPLVKPSLNIKRSKGSDSDSRKLSVLDEEPAHEEMNSR